MARPQMIQRIRHGKLLTKENFPLFVETWNYVVDRLENIKGDADVNPNGGSIRFDVRDPEHPVIRFDGKGAECDCPPLDEVSLSTWAPEPEPDEDPAEPSACIKGWHSDEALSAQLSAVAFYEFVARDAEDGGSLKYVSLADAMASLSGGGAAASVLLDNVSISTNLSGEVCIKGWAEDETEEPSGGLSGYGFVARDLDEKLKYVSLSALGGQCLSAQGNDAGAVPVDCQGKLLKFTEGLSTNLSVEVSETVPGEVDVKIGVYYI